MLLLLYNSALVWLDSARRPEPAAPAYTLWLTTDAGEPQALIEPILRLEYKLVTNGVGVLVLVLPRSFDERLLRVDWRLEVWRGAGTTLALEGETCWFIRYWARDEQDNLIVRAYSATTLLTRRIVAYAAGTSYSEKTAPADDLVKAVVRENLGAMADDPDRDWHQWLQIEDNQSLAPTVARAFSRREVLAVCQDVCRESTEAGTALWFDIVKDSAQGLLFRTYTGQRGADRSGEGTAGRVVLAPEMGNLADPFVAYDYSEEATVIYAAGQGQESARRVVEVEDAARTARSVFGRIEGLRDARSLTTEAALAAEGQTALRERRPRRHVRATLLETATTRYGMHWRWGDRVAWRVGSASGTATIEEVHVRLEGGAEQVSVTLRMGDE